MKRIFPPLIAIFIFLSTLLPTAAISAASIVHIVVRGDTLYSLSLRYGTTVDAIMWANHLTSTIIYIDQKLHIASSDPTAGSATYTVVRGDTLYSISRRYGMTVKALMTLNNLHSTLIYVDQHLVVTQATSPMATSTPIPTAIPTLIPLTPTATLTTTPALTPTATPNCDRESYPDFCVPPFPPDLDCGDEPINQHKGFTVLTPDPHGLDGTDIDGIGCEDN